MNVIGTGYRILGAAGVVVTAGLTAIVFVEGHTVGATCTALVGAAVAWVFWAIGGVINGGVPA